MKLWLTRDNSPTGAVYLWDSAKRPTIHRGAYVTNAIDCGLLALISAEGRGISVEPGTCTRLYTEEEMRRMVADAMYEAHDEQSVAELGRYLADPTDANWQRLANAVWPKK